MNTINTQIDITSNLELGPLTRKTYKRYSVKLRLLATIHEAIDPIANAKREATMQVYHRLEDRFIDPNQNDNEPILLNLDNYNDDNKQTVKPLPLP